jgi:UDP-N-acetylmuramate dehydrogenase
VTDRPVESLDLRYRHSNLKDDEAVIGATFRTVERPREECETTLREITRWRRDHQPGGTFNAGSVFKNPEGDYAGRIIDDLGLKGLRVGGVSVSERHANFFVAEAGSAAQDIHELVETVRARVLAETGIALEPEMRFAGEFGDLS